jgi:hypothetical protein
MPNKYPKLSQKVVVDARRRRQKEWEENIRQCSKGSQGHQWGYPMAGKKPVLVTSDLAPQRDFEIRVLVWSGPSFISKEKYFSSLAMCSVVVVMLRISSRFKNVWLLWAEEVLHVLLWFHFDVERFQLNIGPEIATSKSVVKDVNHLSRRCQGWLKI